MDICISVIIMQSNVVFGFVMCCIVCLLVAGCVVVVDVHDCCYVAHVVRCIFIVVVTCVGNAAAVVVIIVSVDVADGIVAIAICFTVIVVLDCVRKYYYSNLCYY